MIFTAQEFCGWMMEQLLVSAKSPVMVALVGVIGVGPFLVKIRLVAGLVVPMVRGPKFSFRSEKE